LLLLLLLLLFLLLSGRSAERAPRFGLGLPDAGDELSSGQLAGQSDNPAGSFCTSCSMARSRLWGLDDPRKLDGPATGLGVELLRRSAPFHWDCLGASAIR
jgi:hypothetical protein